MFITPLLALALIQALRLGTPASAKMIRVAAIVLLPPLTGGYWYLRNLIITGNPLYPLEVRLGGHTLWSGWYGPEAMRHSVYYIPMANWRALGDTLLAVLDPRLAPVWIAALCTGWAFGSTRTNEQRRAISLLSLLAFLNVVLYWVCIPYRTQQRFMLSALRTCRRSLGRASGPRSVAALLGRFLAGIAFVDAANVAVWRKRGRDSVGPVPARSQRDCGTFAASSRAEQPWLCRSQGVGRGASDVVRRRGPGLAHNPGLASLLASD